MSRRRQIQFKQWLIIALAWQGAACWVSIYDHLAIHSNLAGPEVAPDYAFWSNLIINCSGAAIGALFGASALVFYVNPKFADRPYILSILMVTAIIIVVMTIVTLIVAYLDITLTMGIDPGDPVFRSTYLSYVLDPLNLKDTLYWATVTAFTQFFFQMDAKFGHGALWNIITGRYRLPKEEKRIFMFVDLNFSTTLAEQLGAKVYHQFLKDFFAHLTNPIIDNGGQINQYIGDEIVIAWNFEEGIRQDRCIRCFFEMKKEIARNAEYYQNQYGVVPSFKAGIHAGNVIVGEIGIVKRDITFSGDVLNTTSRIQGKCKELNVEMIASTELINTLPSSGQFTIHNLGTIELRGKQEKVDLSTVISMN